MTKKRIGILTGGGDVPGLNEAIRTLTYLGIDEGNEIIGIRRGWGGLVFHDPAREIFLDDDITNYNNHFVNLTKRNTAKIYATGGTILHSSRMNPKNFSSNIKDIGHDVLDFRGLNDLKNHDFTSDVVKNIKKLRLDYLVVIGGDDTQSYNSYLMNHIPIIGIPKTMDNDIPGVEKSIGFDTAIERAD